MGRMKDVYIDLVNKYGEFPDNGLDPNEALQMYTEELKGVRYYCKTCNKTWSHKFDITNNKLCPECLSNNVETIIKEIE